MGINLKNLKKSAEQKFKKDLKGMKNYKFIAKTGVTMNNKEVMAMMKRLKKSIERLSNR